MKVYQKSNLSKWNFVYHLFQLNYLLAYRQQIQIKSINEYLVHLYVWTFPNGFSERRVHLYFSSIYEMYEYLKASDKSSPF